MFVKDIYAFHANIGNPNSNRLIEYWQKTWTDQGWTPHILSWRDAYLNPLSQKLAAKVKTLPTVNNPFYELACWMRWAAFANHTGLMSDYDVFPQKPFPPREFKGFTNGQAGAAGVIVGTPLDIAGVIQAILTYEPGPKDVYKGKRHVSDMVVLQNRLDIFDHIEPLALCYREAGWEALPLVHFNNDSLKNPHGDKAAQIRSILCNTK
jgi:hypothetical protein